MSSGPYQLPEHAEEGPNTNLVSLADRGRPYKPPSDRSIEPSSIFGGGRGGGGGGDSEEPPVAAWERKRTNKRINEQLKLFATGMNTLAGIILGTSIFVPLYQNSQTFVQNYSPLWFLGGVAVHVGGQIVLGLNYRSEE